MEFEGKWARPPSWLALRDLLTSQGFALDIPNVGPGLAPAKADPRIGPTITKPGTRIASVTAAPGCFSFRMYRLAMW
jgi:hypothetical protein